MRITHKERALQKYDRQILEHVGENFLRTLPRSLLSLWCSRIPEIAFDSFLSQVRDTAALAEQLQQGRARPAKDGFVILDGGKTHRAEIQLRCATRLSEAFLRLKAKG